MAQTSASVIKCDNVIRVISDIKWVARNVFLVNVTQYGKLVSCELTAVDIPRGTADALENVIEGVLECIRDVPHKYLRQDFYSEFPLQGYGDVIFLMNGGFDVPVGDVGAIQEANYKSELQWMSLQEVLLRLGVGRVVRPIITRLENLFEAEKHTGGRLLCDNGKGHSIVSCGWAKKVLELENSPLACEERTGRVVEVLRGDVYVIHWDVDHDVRRGINSVCKTNCNTPASTEKPTLVILDAVMCYSSKTENGYKAMRWAQKNLIYSQVKVYIHSMHPSVKETKNESQIFLCEELTHVRATVFLKTVMSSTVNEGYVDVGCVLLLKGLGLVRQVADAGVPRALNFYPLLQAASKYCISSLSTAVEERSPDTEVPPDVLSTLMEFLGCEWSSKPSVATLWRTVMWDGDINRNAHLDVPCIHTYCPMRALWSMGFLLEHMITFKGYVSSIVLTRERFRLGKHHQQERQRQPRLFLRVEVNAVFSKEMICDMDEKTKTGSLGYLFMYPFEKIVYARELNVRIVYDRYRASADISNTRAYLAASFISYSPKKYNPEEHVPAPFTSPVSLANDEMQAVITLKLTLPEKIDELLFVVDAEVYFGVGTKKLCERQVFVLSASPQDLGDSEELLETIDAAGGDKDEEDEDDDEDEDDTNGDHSDRKESHANGNMPVEGEEYNATQKIPEEWFHTSGKTADNLFYHTKVDFYFELDPEKVLRTNEDMQKVREWTESMMYRDVHCIPVNMAVVNAHRGYVGDILLLGDEDSRSDDDYNSNWAKDGIKKYSVLQQPMEEWSPSYYDSPENQENMWAKIPVLVKEWYHKKRESIIVEETEARSCIIDELWRLFQSLWKEFRDEWSRINGNTMISEVCLAHSTEFDTWEKDFLLTCETNNNNNNNNGEARNLMCVSAGDTVYWYSSECCAQFTGSSTDDGGTNVESVLRYDYSPRVRPVLTPSFLPPHVPLILASIFPRQLFVTHHKAHRGVVPKDFASEGKEGEAFHIDAAFIRLPRRYLRHIHISNYERLPMAMRNVQRGFCESLLQGDAPDVTESSAARMYYAAEDTFASLIAMLLMLQPKDRYEENINGTANRDLKVVYALLGQKYRSLWDVTQSGIRTAAVLYRIWPEKNEGLKIEQKPPILYLGKRDMPINNVFENLYSSRVPSMCLMRQAMSVLGFESLVDPLTEDTNNNDVRSNGSGSKVDMGNYKTNDDRMQKKKDENDGYSDIISIMEESDEKCYPMASRGVGPQTFNCSTPWLYRPLPWLSVLGNPLVIREEYDADTLVRHPGSTEARNMTRRHIAVTYLPILRNDKYGRRPFSYGQVLRRDIFSYHTSRASRGGNVKDYLSLLLRRRVYGNNANSTGFADGMLYVHGTANEPLYVYYQSRDQFRFKLGLTWSFISPDTGSATSNDHGESNVEEKLLQKLSEAARKIIDHVEKKTTRTLKEEEEGKDESETTPLRVYLDIRLQIYEPTVSPNIMRVSIYPVDNNNDGSCEDDPAGDERNVFSNHTNDDHEMSFRGVNPCRPFTMIGTVIRCVPIHVLIVRYSSELGDYIIQWDPDYEPKEATGTVEKEGVEI